LRGSTDLVAPDLARRWPGVTGDRGVKIIQVRVSHLAYAVEIVPAMRRHQRARAGSRREQQPRVTSSNGTTVRW
jgi:hypothetical protein